MASLLIFSSIVSLILAEELPTPDSLRQFGPYGRETEQQNSASDVRSIYSDIIAGNSIRAVRKELIKNHNTGANENHANLKNRNPYNINNNNRFTGTRVNYNNANAENHNPTTNNFPSNNNFGHSRTNNNYITNDPNSVSDNFNSVNNHKYIDYRANRYSYDNHDSLNNHHGASDSGSGNRGRDDIYNIHSGFRDAMKEYGNSGNEEFGNTGEYGHMDATGTGFNPLQGLSSSSSQPQDIKSQQNLDMQDPRVTKGQDTSSKSSGSSSSSSGSSSSNELRKRKGRLQDSVSRQGHGGGYNDDSGIDLYSLMALGLFAAFLGYVIFYYISVNGRRRSIEFSPQEYATLIMAEVFNALERWAVVELMPTVQNNAQFKFGR